MVGVREDSLARTSGPGRRGSREVGVIGDLYIVVSVPLYLLNSSKESIRFCSCNLPNTSICCYKDLEFPSFVKVFRVGRYLWDVFRESCR